MRAFIVTACLAGLMAGTLACGDGPTVRQQRGTVAADRQAGGASSGAARAADPFGGRAPVEPVDVDALTPLFPAVTGWERGEVSGESTPGGGGITQVHLEYSKGAVRVEASIVDSGFNQSYLAPFALFLTQGYRKDTPAGYERAVKFGNYPAWERWDSDMKSGELNVLVAGRYIIQLDGVDIQNTKPLYELMQKFELGKLVQIK